MIKINLILDQFIPPILRDAYWFMLLPMKLCFSEKYQIAMTFQEKLPFMNSAEYLTCYEEMAPYSFSKKGDLNKECTKMILRNLVGDSVLDVGCGSGFLMDAISKQKPNINIIGMDVLISDSLHTEENDKLKYISGNAEEIPLPDKSADTVICTHVLEHVIDLQKAISELRRVAKKRIIIVVPSQRPYRYIFSLHLRFFPYVHSFLLEMMPMPEGHLFCEKIGGDIYYQEDV